MAIPRDVTLKLGRAEQHLAEFEGEFGTFLARKPYSAVVEPDPETGIEILRLKFTEAPAVEWGLAIGDFVQNLRSALDYLIVALRKQNPAAPPPTGSTEFPIFDVANGDAIRKRIQYIDREAREKIKALQPYTRGDRVHEDWLWGVHRLAALNRHERLTVVAHHVTYMIGPVGQSTMGRLTLTGTFQDGDVLPLPLLPRQSGIRGQVVLSFAALADESVGDGYVAVDKLRPIYDYVRDEVIGVFSDFFPDSASY